MRCRRRRLRLEKAQVRKVKNFERQAQDALEVRETPRERMTLATKAKLLLDDLEK